MEKDPSVGWGRSSPKARQGAPGCGEEPGSRCWGIRCSALRAGLSPRPFGFAPQPGKHRSAVKGWVSPALVKQNQRLRRQRVSVLSLTGPAG